jgi:hypothetical protein
MSRHLLLTFSTHLNVKTSAADILGTSDTLLPEAKCEHTDAYVGKAHIDAHHHLSYQYHTVKEETLDMRNQFKDVRDRRRPRRPPPHCIRTH